MKYFSILFIFLVFYSCDVSTSSKSSITSLSNIKASITIQDGTKKNSLNYVEVKLFDDKKQLINENIKILLNNTPLELYVRTGNYYDKHSYYGTDDLSRKDSYYFEIILPDSTRLPIAFIKPYKAYADVKFNIPEQIPLKNDVIISWEGLTTPHTIEIIKGTEVKKKKAANITENGFEGKQIDILHKKIGEYVIPKSYFRDSLTLVKFLNIKLSRKETGLINTKLLPDSEIVYSFKTEKTISYHD
jgi:hypothetical protein